MSRIHAFNRRSIASRLSSGLHLFHGRPAVINSRTPSMKLSPNANVSFFYRGPKLVETIFLSCVCLDLKTHRIELVRPRTCSEGKEASLAPGESSHLEARKKGNTLSVCPLKLGSELSSVCSSETKLRQDG